MLAKVKANYSTDYIKDELKEQLQDLMKELGLWLVSQLTKESKNGLLD